MKNLNGIQFSVYPYHNKGEDRDTLIEAHDPSIGEEYDGKRIGTLVGDMSLDASSGEISGVNVREDYQRRGIASEMYELAKIAHKHFPDKYPYPEHSPARTPDGNAWAKAVGGRLPKHEECVICGLYGHLAEDCTD